MTRCNTFHNNSCRSPHLVAAFCFWIAIITLCKCDASAQDTSLSLVKYVAQRGDASTQGISALKTLDASGTNDNWDDYVELSAGSAKVFNVVFLFKLQNTATVSTEDISELAVQANTIGLEKKDQRRIFEIRNVRTNKWVYIGDNRNAPSWIWHMDNFQVPRPARGFADFFDNNNRVRIRVRSNNKADVANVDYLAVVASSSSNTDTPTLAPVESTTDDQNPSGLWLPKASEKLTWQWQLQGTLDKSFNVDMYDIDLFDTSTATIQSLKNDGRIVVCYFSAGTYEGWRDDWAKHFPFINGDSYNGNEKPFAGNMAEWDERWLDIREMDLLEGIMRERLELAVSKGCDAVEPDNMDAYSNPSETKLSLTYNDQLKYNRWLANLAHEVGISVGLKNDVDQLADLVDYYDWALNEECFAYNECDGYSDTFLAKDKAVFGVEYSGSPSTFCPKANTMGMSWLKKKLNLKAYRVGCENYA